MFVFFCLLWKTLPPPILSFGEPFKKQKTFIHTNMYTYDLEMQFFMFLSVRHWFGKRLYIATTAPMALRLHTQCIVVPSVLTMTTFPLAMLLTESVASCKNFQHVVWMHVYFLSIQGLLLIHACMSVYVHVLHPCGIHSISQMATLYSRGSSFLI